MQGSPDAKKPCKGILKTSSSFDKHSSASCHRKSAKFDELNVLQTYHPPDKDYGHMKIEEPKTPYNYSDSEGHTSDQLDAELLSEKLTKAANTRTSSFEEEESSDEEYPDETPEEKARRKQFETRRRAHYNEFEAVRLARKLIEEEDDDDDENLSDENINEIDIKPSQTSIKLQSNDTEQSTTTAAAVAGTSSDKNMDVELTEDAQNTSPSSENEKF